MHSALVSSVTTLIQTENNLFLKFKLFLDKLCIGNENSKVNDGNDPENVAGVKGSLRKSPRWSEKA